MTGFDRVVRIATIRVAPVLSAVCIAPVIVSLAGGSVPASLDPRVLATLAALFFGVFSFFYRSHEAERQSKKQHTLKMLFDTRLSSEFRQHLERRKMHFPEGEFVDPAKFMSYLRAERDRDLSDDEARERRQSAEALRSLLNYYEFIALGIARDDLDEEMLKGTIRGIMCNLVMDCVHLIVDVREDDPRTFEHLARLYERWRDDAAEPIPLD